MLKQIKSRGQYEIGNFRTKGIYEAWRLITDRTIQRLCLSRFRTAMRPSLHQLAGNAQSIHMSALELVKTALPDITSEELNTIKEEYSSARTELERRVHDMKDRLEYPDWYAIESETSFLYYAVCRHLRPRNVLETGIANGHSSFFLIQAIKKNGQGRLHSIDIADNVGRLLTEAEKLEWTLHVLGSPQRGSFREIVKSISNLDLFVHDSDHTYGWQMFEFQIAYQFLSENGVLLSDDIDHSLAFLDFCAEISQKPVLLLDTRKVTGMILPGD